MDADDEPWLQENKITVYVEHPVPIQPPAEGVPPAPAPLKLTKRELKKLRTQNRQRREKEKQDLIRQGLLEPPKPKVKISNLARVMGEQAAADPTAIEKEVRKQMAERQAAHDDRNLANMKTPAEKRANKLRKMFDDDGLETLVAVYRVERLSDGRQRFKVDVNAKENHMTGCMLVAEPFCLVVVEGCSRALKRYNKLMLRRIDWAGEEEGALGDEGGEEEGAQAMDVDGSGAAQREPNACHLVWQGSVKDATFKEFVRLDAKSSVAGRALLAERGVAHYWDAAASWDPDAAPLEAL